MPNLIFMSCIKTEIGKRAKSAKNQALSVSKCPGQVGFKHYFFARSYKDLNV